MTLNGVMAVTLQYFTEFGKTALQKTISGGIYAKVLYLVRVQCRRKESSRSLSHLLMSFLYIRVNDVNADMSKKLNHHVKIDHNGHLNIRLPSNLRKTIRECVY